jgi:hypothetical protein
MTTPLQLGTAAGAAVSRPVVAACFVHTPCRGLRDDRLEPPLGLLFVATHANARGQDYRIRDLPPVADPVLDRHVPDGLPRYGFSTYSVNYGTARELIARSGAEPAPRSSQAGRTPPRSRTPSSPAGSSS